MKQVTIPCEIEVLASQAINAALAVHRALGPGLLESAYEECLTIELTCLGLTIERQKAIPLIYRDRQVDVAYRLDLIVNRQLLIEAKAVESILPVHRVQVATYLRLLHLPLGLLINFNVPLLKEGLHRVLNLDFRA
jgi:GxxExxY protein